MLRNVGTWLWKDWALLHSRPPFPPDLLFLSPSLSPLVQFGIHFQPTFLCIRSYPGKEEGSAVLKRTSCWRAQVDLMYFLANPHSYCQILPGQVHRPPWLVSCPPRGDAANARLVAENVFWVLHRVLILPSRFCVCFAYGDLERLKNDVATTATFSESISTGSLTSVFLQFFRCLLVLVPCHLCTFGCKSWCDHLLSHRDSLRYSLS